MRGSKAKKLRQTAKQILTANAAQNNKEYDEVAIDVVSQQVKEATKFDHPIKRPGKLPDGTDGEIIVGYYSFEGQTRYQSGFKFLVKKLKQMYA